MDETRVYMKGIRLYRWNTHKLVVSM